MPPQTFSFTRYLASKKTVDDRALNAHVWQTLAAVLPAGHLNVLEVGAGIGTMAERVAERGLLTRAHYTVLDELAENIAVARERLAASPLNLEFQMAEALEFCAQPEQRGRYDLLIAHAFLDLLDLRSALPVLLAALKPGGVFYFTLNFDGGTVLQPEIERALDDQIEALYHRTMDERLTHGQPSGDSRYPADEAYFLHFIIHTLHGALCGHPELNRERFEQWIAQRHAQIERGELVYIAHQMDFVGKTLNPG